MENIVQLTLEELEVKGKFYELIGYLNSYTDTRVINEKEKEMGCENNERLACQCIIKKGEIKIKPAF